MQPLHPQDCKCPICGQILHWPGNRRRDEPTELPSDPGASTVHEGYYDAYTASTMGTNLTIPMPFNGSHLEQCLAVRHVKMPRALWDTWTCSCGAHFNREAELMLHFRDNPHDWTKLLTLREMEDM